MESGQDKWLSRDDQGFWGCLLVRIFKLCEGRLRRKSELFLIFHLNLIKIPL